MSGTYSIDGIQLRVNPGIKTWNFDAGKFGSDGAPQLPPYWGVEWTFPPLEVGTGTTLAFIAGKYNEGGLHSVVMSHPSTGYLTVFSGVAITGLDVQYADIDNDGYAQGVRLRLGHISSDLAFRLEKQPYWWFGNDRAYIISASGSIDTAGTTVTLSVTLQNNDMYPLAETVTAIPTPTGLSYSSSVGNGSFNSVTDEWTLSALAGGDTASIIITYTVTSVAIYEFTATVDASPYSNVDPANDTATETVMPWWLAAGLTAADVYGAYNAVGAANLNDSLVNRNNAGVNDLTVGVAPVWDATNGWTFSGTEYLKHPSNAKQEMSIIAAITFTTNTPSPNAILGTAESATSDMRLQLSYSAGIQTYQASHYLHYLLGAKYESISSGVVKKTVFGISCKPLIDNGDGSYSKQVRAVVGSSLSSLPIKTILTEFFTTGTIGIGVGAVITTTTPVDFFVGKIHALAYYNKALTDDQLSAIAAAMGNIS